METMPDYADFTVSMMSTFHSAQRNNVLAVNETNWLQEDLRILLQTHFSLREVTSVTDGLAMACSWLPDLIITDSLLADNMKESICLRLKNDTRTYQIPVVMLTDRDDVQRRIQSFYLGADDYIRMPVDWLELFIRMNNLIATRKVLRSGAQRQLLISPEAVVTVSREGGFIKRVKEVLEGHIDDTQFGSVSLAREMGMSQTCLYRRLKLLAGCSSNDYIRKYRLLRAADLLRQRVGNVSEVAYQVGFNSLSYFAKCFKEQFKMAPKEFARQAQ
jgi:AraC-like DNA-binding protein